MIDDDNQPSEGIEFAPQDKIDSRVDDMLQKLFDIEGAWVSNEATLDMYSTELHEDDWDEFHAGHKQLALSEIPEDDKHLYEEDFKHCVEHHETVVRLRAAKHMEVGNESPRYDRFFVWYPPYTEEEQEQAYQDDRKEIARRIQEVYGVSMNDFTGDKAWYVWEVADFIDKELLKQLGRMPESG